MVVQQAQYVGPMLIQCCSTVYDAGPTLDQHRANAEGQRIVPAGM